MLLRRITEHLRTQNWAAVTLDLVVVVVGIFLAFQVERWYENRRLVSEEEVHLVALAEEFAAARESVDWIISRFSRAAEAAQTLLNLDEESGRNIGNDEFYRLVADAQRMGSLESKRQTYDSLIATGKIEALRDDALKVALSEYYSIFERLQTDESRWEDQLTIVWEPYVTKKLDRVMIIKYAHPDDTRHLRPTHAPDRYIQLIGSDEFEGTISKRWHFYRDRGHAMRELLDNTKQVERLIAESRARVSTSQH
jgi:hypothetical protein